MLDDAVSGSSRGRCEVDKDGIRRERPSGFGLALEIEKKSRFWNDCMPSTEPKPTEPKPTEPKPIEPRPIEPRPIEPRPKSIEPRQLESGQTESKSRETDCRIQKTANPALGAAGAAVTCNAVIASAAFGSARTLEIASGTRVLGSSTARSLDTISATVKSTKSSDAAHDSNPMEDVAEIMKDYDDGSDKENEDPNVVSRKRTAVGPDADTNPTKKIKPNGFFFASRTAAMLPSHT